MNFLLIKKTKLTLAIICYTAFLLCCQTDKNDKSLTDAAVSQNESQNNNSTAFSNRDSIKKAEETPYEIIDNIWLLKTKISQFDNLTLDNKKKLLESTKEAEKQDTQLYQLNGPQHLQIKNMLEQIMLKGQKVPASIKKRIRLYTKQFWLYRGTINPFSKTKIRPKFIPGEFAAATQIAMQSGAKIDTSEIKGVDLAATQLEELEFLLKLVRPWIFTKKIKSTKKSNTNVIDGGINDSTNESIDTGKKHFAKYLIANNIQKKNTAKKEPLNNYKNSKIGAIVRFENSEFKSALTILNKKADVIDKKIRLVGGLKSVVSTAFETSVKVEIAVLATGVYGPIWQNEVDFYSTGALLKNEDTNELMFFSNIDDAYEKHIGKIIVEHFSPNEDVKKRRLKYRTKNKIAMVVLREIAGKGLDGTEKKPTNWFINRLGYTNKIVEEMRADLAALYLAFDADVKTSGLIKDDEHSFNLFEDYIATSFEIIGLKQEQGSAATARLIILNYLIEKDAVQIKQSQNDHFYPQIISKNQMQNAIEKLLIEIRRIRFAGDGAAATAMVAQFGKAKSIWKDDIISRMNNLDLPSRPAFVYPLLEYQTDTTSEIINVNWNIPSNFYTRQLSLSN